MHGVWLAGLASERPAPELLNRVFLATDTNKLYYDTGAAWTEIVLGGGGADPWTVLALAADFTTSGMAAVDATGLGFTPVANTRYEFCGVLSIRTATATVNPRVGIAWPTGLTDGVAVIDEAQTATTQLLARGNIGTAMLVAVGGLPNTTQSWPVIVRGFLKAGATPVGAVRIQLASETSGTIVRIVTDSFLRYRSY